MDELVSVLLPVYKEPIGWVQDAIESITTQTYSAIELVIIIDNPERFDVVEWAQKLDCKCRKVIIINEKNIGLVASLNKGIGLCSGGYIARMDADDISLCDRIEKQLRYMREHNYDLVGGNVELFNEKGPLGKSRLPHSQFKLNHYIKNGGGIPHPTWLVKKKVFMDLEGYRNLRFVEDYDFLVRAVIKGYKLGVVQDVCLKYRQNPEGITQGNKGEQKLIAKVITEQLKYNSVWNLDKIHSRVEGSVNEIEQHKDYYKYTRKMRNAIKTGQWLAVIQQIRLFKRSYFRILFYDLRQDVSQLFFCL